MTLKQNLIKIIPLTIILCGLLTYSFMQAQWVGPGQNPPADNVPAPINIGGDYQAKLGDLGAIRMRSGAYCNALGTICVTSLQGRVSGSCPLGQAIRAINANGTVACQSVTSTTTPAQTCKTESTTRSSCSYPSGYMGNTPSCPAGYTPTGPSEQQGSCSTNDYTFVRTCIRTICS